ncbi:MAG TPA: GAF domain-containing sensor histidine kinase [Candidatus Limnocylindrales bacterium]|nr:GAF domain-containing sensor histidine kinase [Candidatus Limnocylindrales bacterium]
MTESDLPVSEAERLAALDEATRAIAAELDIERVLQLIVDRVRELIGATHAALGIADASGHMERFITSGISPRARAAIGAAPDGHGLLGLIIHEARTVRTADISHHPARFGFPENHPVMRSFLGVPVLVKGRSVGNLYLTDKVGGEFTEDDERLLELFAVHAGIAIDNARLHDQVQRLAIVEERERIGRDLHDGIIQAIYAVGLSLEDVLELLDGDAGRPRAAERVDQAIDALNLVIADIRSYILRLRDDLTGDEDPVESLARLTEELGMHAVVDLEVDLDGGAETLRSMPHDRCTDVLFIAREALSNVARHSGATRTALTLNADGNDLELCVEDNGRGFDPAALPGPDAFGRHMGVANMRDRAASLGGTMSIESVEPSGTRIIVRVPAIPSVPVTGDLQTAAPGVTEP